MTVAAKLTLPAASNGTARQLAAIRLLLAVYIEPAVPNLQISEGSELSLTTASSASGSTSDFLSIFKSLLELADQTSRALIGDSLPSTSAKVATSADLTSSLSERYITLAAIDNSNVKSFAKDVDSQLVDKMYVTGSQLTAGDVAVFAGLHCFISQASHETRLAHPNATRHFDLMQHNPSIVAAIRKLPENTLPTTPINIDLDNVPLVDRKAELTKKEKKPAKVTAAEGSEGQAVATDAKSRGKKAAKAPTAATAETEPQASADTTVKALAPTDWSNTIERKQKVKKEAQVSPDANVLASKGKEKKGGTSGAGGAPSEIESITPGLIDLRVGKIIDVKKHPDADSLYVEQIDIGETEPRTVVSGLVNYIPIEEMQGKMLICVCNLKPAAMRGIKSYAMVLAATSKDGKDGRGSVELVAPPENSKPGDRVYFEGFDTVSPLEQLPPKKKIFEAIQPGFTTLDTREAAWVDPQDLTKVHRIVTSRGSCKAPTFVGASLS